MIHFLNVSHQNMGEFRNYNDLADYIHKIESSRTKLLIAGLDLNPSNDWEQEHWGFAVYTHEFSKTIYSAMRAPPLTGIELEAFQQGLDLVEIYYGDANNPVQIPITEDIDIESLRKDWCLAYCKAHNYTVLDTLETKGMDFEDTGSREKITGGKDDLAL